MSEPFRVVGQNVRRLDGREKLTGRAVYTGDISLPRLAHAAIFRSPLAHARIRRLDTAAAATAPGVLAVVDATSLDRLTRPRYGHAVEDQPVVAQDVVRYVGEPVAVVVAETERAAHRAVDLIVTDFDPLPAACTVEEALAEDAPLVHAETAEQGDYRGFTERSAVGRRRNVCEEAHVEWGDVDAAFAEAAYVVEGTYELPMGYAYAMEPYVTVADVTDRQIVVYSAAQHPYMVRTSLARLFGLGLGAVRVIAPYLGGSYGSKAYTKLEPLVALCSLCAGRPVRLALNADEAMLTIRTDGFRVHMQTACDAAGRLLGREATVLMDTGAYAQNSPLVCKKTAVRAIGPYHLPSVRVHATAVYTHTVPADSFRGFGAPPGVFAGESQLDELASRAGLSPVELRRRNLGRPGERIHPALRPLDADLPADLELLGDLLGPAPVAVDRGQGVAVSASDAGAIPITSAAVRLHGDGSVTVLTGSTEIGQGSHTVLAQIAAEETGVAFERVSIVAADSAVAPFERNTGASRTTTLMGRAIREAAADALRRIEALGVSEVADLRATAEDGRPGWAVAIDRYYGIRDIDVTGHAALRQADDLAELPVFWEVGCTGVEVVIDRELGLVRPRRLAAVGDVGLAINPALAEAQDLGAATMGLGLGLFEELRYDGQQLANGSLLDYRVPRFRDLAPGICSALAERREGPGPYGAKGGGEGAINPFAAALANAVAAATGARVRRLPLTPERVWRALRDGPEAAVAAGPGTR